MCTVFFPFTRVSGFVLSKCLQSSFVVSLLSSGHVRAMERMCQFLRYLPPLRIWILQTALFLTSTEQDSVPVRWRRKSTKFSYKLRNCFYSCRAYPDSKTASRRFPIQWLVWCENDEKWTRWLAALQPVLPHWKRMQRPFPVDAARQDLGIHSDTLIGSTATGSLGSHGPGSSDDSRNTRRRLDTFSSPEDEQAQSAVILRFPCEQYHTGIIELDQ